jgi:hypothetical protein
MARNGRKALIIGAAVVGLVVVGRGLVALIDWEITREAGTNPTEARAARAAGVSSLRVMPRGVSDA